MPAKKYIINLSAEERDTLTKLVSTGQNKARRITRARALLLADCGDNDEQIAHSLGIAVPTIERLRKRVLLEGPIAALDDHHRAGLPPKFDDAVELTMVAIACTKAPPGHAKWSLQLIADELVSLGIVESISPETVRRRLKKKPAQALAEARVGHPQLERGVRLPDGGSTNHLRPALQCG